MKKSSIIWIVIAIVVIGGGIFYWASNNGSPNNGYSATPTPATTPTQTPTPSPVAAAAVLDTSSNAKLGTFLVSPNGMTLYRFTADTQGVSTCTGQCAAVWPPYTVTSTSSLPVATGITGAVGSFTRNDGTIQVTYNGSPLYFFAKDANPGDTKGQNVEGTWFVVNP